MLIDKATEAQGLAAAILYRDGLLIALLALVPLRRRNIAGLQIGRNLIDVNGTWVIALDAIETKTRTLREDQNTKTVFENTKAGSFWHGDQSTSFPRRGRNDTGDCGSRKCSDGCAVAWPADIHHDRAVLSASQIIRGPPPIYRGLIWKRESAMTRAKNTKTDIEARASLLVFPALDDWKTIVRDLKLSKGQERELEITIRQVIATIHSYRERPQRDTVVAALKRLEKALDHVQYEMARSKQLMNYFLPSKILEFIGTSFTFAAIGQAVGEDVLPIDPDFSIHGMVEMNNYITIVDLESHYYNDRMALGYKYGGKILKHFIDVIYADLKSWVELDRGNTGGRPADIYRQYMIQRLAVRASWIIGQEATTTASGRFAGLCGAVLPACRFSSKGIEKAVEAVLEKMEGKDVRKRVKRKAKSKRQAASNPRNRR